nr:serine/arginine repetitive matrix protein 1 [Taeniopygia guttata]
MLGARGGARGGGPAVRGGGGRRAGRSGGAHRSCGASGGGRAPRRRRVSLRPQHRAGPRALRPPPHRGQTPARSVRRRRERRRQKREFHFQRSKQKVEQVEADREQPGGKRGRRFPRRPERSGARGLCGGRDVRGCGGREGARAGLSDRRNFARQHRFEIGGSHPEGRGVSVGRGEERLPLPRGLLRPPVPSPAGKERVLAAGCGGSAVLSAAAGAHRDTGAQPVRALPEGTPAPPPSAQLGPRARRAARSPPLAAPAAGSPGARLFPPAQRCPHPPESPALPTAPTRERLPPPTPARRSPSCMKPLARFPPPQLRIPSPVPGAFPRLGVPPWLAPSWAASSGLWRAEKPSGTGRERGRGVDVTRLQTLHFPGPGGARSGALGGGTGLSAFLGQGAAGAGAGGAPAAAQVPRSRIPHFPEQCSKAGRGFTCTSSLFG